MVKDQVSQMLFLCSFVSQASIQCCVCGLVAIAKDSNGNVTCLRNNSKVLCNASEAYLMPRSWRKRRDDNGNMICELDAISIANGNKCVIPLSNITIVGAFSPTEWYRICRQYPFDDTTFFLA